MEIPRQRKALDQFQHFARGDGLRIEKVTPRSMQNANSGQQTSLHIRECGRHPRVEFEGLNVVGDEAVEKWHRFRAADVEASAGGEIDQPGTAFAYGCVLSKI